MDNRMILKYPYNKQLFESYIHQVLNYRYNWHDSLYEINILLSGSAEICFDNQNVIMQENDVVIIDPNVGHASFSLESNTLMLVVHFSSDIFNQYLPIESSFSFKNCFSNAQNRESETFKRIRFYSSFILNSISKEDKYHTLAVNGYLSLLLHTLCGMDNIEIKPKSLTTKKTQHLQTVQTIIKFIEDNYSSKITLEDLALHTTYNRTYISTIFKNTVGLNFYEYLTRFRFQKALTDLAITNKNLTEVAIDNGFPDLKTFNSRFQTMFKTTPFKYRVSLSKNNIIIPSTKRVYIDINSSSVQNKFKEYNLRKYT